MGYARRQRRIPALSLIAVVVGVTFMTSLASGWAGAQTKVKTYPRDETLITIGTQWGNIAGFNPYMGNYAVGTVGLCNETLLRYDPLKDKYINWLAKRARFTGPREFTVTIRSGIKWSDGLPLTARDVAWNFALGRFTTAFWNDLYLNLKSITTPKAKVRVFAKNKKGRVVKVCKKVRGKTKRICKKKTRIALVPGNRVVVTFAGTPNYAQWQNLLWNLPMISPTQGQVITDAASLTTYSPQDPIGTGPYTLDVEGYDPTTRVVWKKKAVWWAAQKGLAPSPAPTYVIDAVHHCNLSFDLFCGEFRGWEDLNNFHVPGIQYLVANGQARTYFPGPPYHLQASTAWLVPNTTRKPLDDKSFRHALAAAVDVNQIVTNDYGNLTANPTGLLPTWTTWVDPGLLDRVAVFGSPSADVADHLLDAAAYPKDASGWYTNKDGSPIDLGVLVHSERLDWESARDLIVTALQAAHIHAHPVWAPSRTDVQSARDSGSFDLLIDDTYQLSDNPWTYFNGIFHLPILSTQTFANFERYQNPAAWADVQKLDQTPLEDSATRRSLMYELEHTFVDELPLIPLWYEGMWAQWQSKYWTNWPQDGTDRQFVPTMWRGYLQMTGIDMITHLQPS